MPTNTAISTCVAYALKHPDLARVKAALVRAELRRAITNALADIVGRRAAYDTGPENLHVVVGSQIRCHRDGDDRNGSTSSKGRRAVAFETGGPGDVTQGKRISYERYFAGN